MFLARAISRGARLKARLGVKGSQKASRSLVCRATAAAVADVIAMLPALRSGSRFRQIVGAPPAQIRPDLSLYTIPPLLAPLPCRCYLPLFLRARSQKACPRT